MDALTENEVDVMSAPLSLDLVAVFSQIEEDTYRLLDKALEEQWDTDKLIDEIVNLL